MVFQGSYSLDELRDKRVVIVPNVKPGKFRGVLSHGALLAGHDIATDQVGVFTTREPVAAGTLVAPSGSKVELHM